MTDLTNWELSMARLVATRSKDPSTKVGAIILDGKHRVVSTGYNGFARGVEDTEERLTNRDVKYRMILHAEANAILFAAGSTEGATMVTTHPCCAHCAAMIIQSGIHYVMWPKPTAEMEARWGAEFDLARTQFKEADVVFYELTE